MNIGIITAMPEEFRAVADCLGEVIAVQLGVCRAGRFTSAGHEFLLVESGVGIDNAAGATETLIRDGHFDLLISTGFCGGVAPELQTGDVVVAEHIVIATEEGFDEIPVLFSSIGQTFVERQTTGGKRFFLGTFVTTTAITSKKHLAGVLPGHYPSPVVEMESGAIAIIAAEHNIPLLAIRAVSDTAAEELGFSLDEFCDPEMRRIRLYNVLRTVLRKPRIIPQLVRLAFSSRTAAQSLTAALSRLFSAL
jgi:adenosylhomocysteine nucleosidase